MIVDLQDWTLPTTITPRDEAVTWAAMLVALRIREALAAGSKLSELVVIVTPRLRRVRAITRNLLFGQLCDEGHGALVIELGLNPPPPGSLVVLSETRDRIEWRVLDASAIEAAPIPRRAPLALEGALS